LQWEILRFEKGVFQVGITGSFPVCEVVDEIYQIIWFAKTLCSEGFAKVSRAFG